MRLFFLFLLFLSSLSYASIEKIDVASDTALTKISKNNEILKNWSLLKLADLDIAKGNFNEALNRLDKIDENSSFDFWKNVLLAKTYLNLKAPNKSLELLLNLPSDNNLLENTDQDFFRNLYKEALLTKKAALDKLGKNSENVAQLLWALFPDDTNLQNSLGMLNVSNNSKIVRLHVLFKLNTFDEIPLLITPENIAKSDVAIDDKCQAFFEWAQANKSLKNAEPAMNGYSWVVAQNCGDDLVARALYWKGRLLWQANKTEEAISIYDLLYKRFPTGRLSDDALSALWKIYEAKKDVNKTNEAYKNLLKLQTGDMLFSTLWDKGYENYKKGNYKKAIEFFDEIIKRTPGEDEYYPQALYWKARSLERTGSQKNQKTISPNQIYQRLVNEFPYSFYSVLAHEKGKIKPNFTHPSPPALTATLSKTFLDGLAVVDILKKDGLNNDAQSVLDYLTQIYPDQTHLAKTLVAEKWTSLDNPSNTLAFALDAFNISANEGVLKKDSPLAFALYPIAFPESTKFSYEKTRLPMGIIEGIMREESLFKTDIRSWAGAVGLMQLMPRTAQMMAQTMGLTNFSTQQLTDPQTNILLGSHFFKKMLDNYDGNLAYAIMAYNAGPGNVNKWIRSQGHQPLDEFIENCPFKETRGYVKRVLRSSFVYGQMFNEDYFAKKFLVLN